MADETLTPRHMDILLHTVGLDLSKVPYRNAYVTARGSESDQEVQALVHAGLMDSRPYPLRDHHGLYQVTPAGLALARHEAGRRRIAQESCAGMGGSKK